MISVHARRLWVAVAVAGLMAASLVAGGFAGAGAVPISSVAAPTVLKPDTIATVAGGVGGPDPAPSTALDACGVRSIGGALYVGTSDAIARISPATDRLTNVAGDNTAESLNWTQQANGVRASSTGILGACNISVDSHGNILFAANFSSTVSAIYVVVKNSGTFYGKRMTAGGLYAIDTATFGINPIVDVEPDRSGNLIVTVDGAPAQCGECQPSQGGVFAIAGHSGTFYGQKMIAGRAYILDQLGSFIGNLRVDQAGNLVIANMIVQAGDFSQLPLGPQVGVIAAREGTFYGQKMRPGRYYVIAGAEALGHAGNGVPATRAELYSADAVTLDGHGNVLISDWGQIRVVAVLNGTFYGQKMRAGYIYTIAGTTEPALYGSPGPFLYSGDGGPALKAVFASVSVAVDASGNVVIAADALRVLVVAEKTGTFYGKKMRAGYIYSIAGNGTFDHSGDGGPATSAELDPYGLAYDRVDGLTLIPDISGSPLAVSPYIRVVASRSGTFFGQKMTAGDIYTIAGGEVRALRSGAPATSAGFSFHPGEQLAATPAGNVIVPQYYPLNVVQVVADRTGIFYGQHMKAGYVYTIAGDGTAGYAGDGGPALKAELNGVFSAAVDRDGNILLADTARVRVIAAKTGTFYGVAMTAGDIYTIAGDGSLAYSGDGGPARAAGIAPAQVTLDSAGNVLIGDLGNGRIRLIAVRAGTFYGVSMTAHDIYTIAGDGCVVVRLSSCAGLGATGRPATSVPLDGNGQTAVDPAGNIVLDNVLAYGDQIAVVAGKSGTFYGVKMKAGDIYSIGGSQSLSFVFGDGGPATKASLENIEGVSVTPAGNVLVADPLNFRIRSIAGG